MFYQRITVRMKSYSKVSSGFYEQRGKAIRSRENMFRLVPGSSCPSFD
jgi:hypothetical protein